MRTMSDETEQRMCDEDFGTDEEGEEADVESYLEDNSSELMDRLRELEAENSALMLANESQREAYERCLDEVANHVVQALLNQKDLREECIKLKMLVFDLERQNRALCELFQQKLPNHPPAQYQVQAGLLPDYNAQQHNDSAKQVEPPQTDAQAKGNGFCAQHASPGPRAPAASMEALSPFFKKKAHILEVLRKMEETDPLKFHPSTAGLSFCDYSQVLMSTEAVLAAADPLPRPCKSHHPHPRCSCSCSDSDSHQHVNGDGAAKCEGGGSCCLLHCKGSPGTPSKTCTCGPSKVDPSLEGPAPEGRAGEVAAQEPAGTSPHSSLPQNLEGVAANSHPPDAPSRTKADEERDSAQACDLESSSISNGGVVDDPPERNGPDSEPPSVRASASVSPSPSCLNDVKSAAINSPSKLLKLLKIPSIGDKSPAPPPPVRLSPQLTRSSRIPCRTNNYEVYHSPVPTRRATTAERCRQPPPPPSRSESYPAAHSAPTSPPQLEGASSLPVKELSYGGPPAPKPDPPRAPHYENVCEMSVSRAEDRRTTLPAAAKPGGGERKLVKSLPESVMSPRHLKPPSESSSESTTDEDEDEDEDSDGPLWVTHHSLPTPSGVSKPQTRPSPCRGGPREVSAPSPYAAPAHRRSESSSIPKRPAAAPPRSQPDSGHHAFKDRLAALGKLRSAEDLQGGVKVPDAAEERGGRTEESQREEQRLLKHPDASEHKPKGAALKYPGKQEPSPPKLDVPKSRIGLPSPNSDAPQVLRNNIKCPASLNLPFPAKAGASAQSNSSSPNRIPPKSPSRACPPTSVYRGGKPADAPRYSSKSEERIKIGGRGKKNPMFGDSLPPPPPKPPSSEGERHPPPPPPPPPGPQSAIEQKVMKGIEENVLKLQEQDRGIPGGEVKQKASNGIASWFGLKKSKLPALSRKADPPKAKDEKREWKINIPSVGRDSGKASRCKEGVEGLNISTLMEKAEGLRRALEEERAYVERSGRGHSCEVVMDQSQGQLAVMYRGGRSDNFMQQLLNRVDGKDVVSVSQRRLSFDCKTSKPVFGPSGELFSHSSHEDMEKGSERIGKVTSDENLADSVHSQHFAGSGASTYTLDSGIGTFPLPDCSSGTGRGLSKARGGAERRSSDSPGRAGRRARTLDRDPTVQDEGLTPHKQPVPTIQYGSGLEGGSGAGGIREDREVHGANVFTPRSKTWTFPNLKTPAGHGEVYLAVEEEEEEEAITYGSPYRENGKAGPPASSVRAAEPGSLSIPAQSAGVRRGKTRSPSEGGLELLRERPEEALSPGRPTALETPESLSDSLYDSLSSCGSQG